MSTNLFSGLWNYCKEVFSGVRSVFESCMVALPYLWSEGDLRKEVTEQYPDPVSSRTPDDLPARSRGILHNDIEKCTGCRECEKVCPVNCITIENELGADEGKIWVSTFDIDFSRCTFCGLCVESCQPASLTHTRQYEGAVYKLSDMAVNFGRGKVTPEQRFKWAQLRRAREEEGYQL